MAEKIEKGKVRMQLGDIRRVALIRLSENTPWHQVEEAYKDALRLMMASLPLYEAAKDVLGAYDRGGDLETALARLRDATTLGETASTSELSHKQQMEIWIEAHAERHDEHPEYPGKWWQEAVQTGACRCGYFQWLMIKAAERDNMKG